MARFIFVLFVLFMLSSMVSVPAVRFAASAGAYSEDSSETSACLY